MRYDGLKRFQHYNVLSTVKAKIVTYGPSSEKRLKVQANKRPPT